MKPQHWLVHFGRLLLASLFILGGINKILNFGATLVDMNEAGLPFASVLLPLVILLELAGGLLVARGRRGAFSAAMILAAFTLATNLVFHDFWTDTGREAELQLSLFFKNVSIAGALIMVGALHRSTKSED